MVRRGFWPKLRRVAAQVPFAEDAAALWFAARDPEVPVRTKAIILAALAYFVLPTGWIPLIGWADDAAVIAAAIALTRDSVKERHRLQAREVLSRLASGP